MRDSVSSPRPPSAPVRAALALVVVVLAGAIGSAATLPAVPTWYASLAKPAWTPPNGAFGPAWTTLFLLMAGAFFRVLGTPSSRAGRSAAIGTFLVHMALNALWSALFFGARSPALGLIEVVFLWSAAVANAVLFWRLDRFAGALMVPNVLWVSFAAALNYAVWRLN